MQLRCPGCRSLLSIPPGLVGSAVRCQYCSEVFRADAEPSRSVPAPPPRPSRPAPPTRDFDRPSTPRRSLMPLWLLIPFSLVAMLGLALVLGAAGYFAFGRSSAPEPEAVTLTSQGGAGGALPRDMLERIKAMTVF